MSDQHCLTVLSKPHQIRFPMTGLATFLDVGGTPLNAHPVFDMIDRTAAPLSSPSSLALAPGKIMPPAIILSAPDLRVDKPIDRLIADDRTSVFSPQPAGNLSWRPALSQSFKHLGLKGGITQQSASPPTSALRLLLGISRLITELATAVAFKLSRYSRWRAIHNCRDLADCFPGLAKTGNSTAVFK